MERATEGRRRVIACGGGTHSRRWSEAGPAAEATKVGEGFNTYSRLD